MAFLPETAAKSLEGMDELFNLPWHIIGRKVAGLMEGKGSVAEAMAMGDFEKIAYVEGNREHAEHVEVAAGEKTVP